MHLRIIGDASLKVPRRFVKTSRVSFLVGPHVRHRHPSPPEHVIFIAIDRHFGLRGTVALDTCTWKWCIWYFISKNKFPTPALASYFICLCPSYLSVTLPFSYPGSAPETRAKRVKRKHYSGQFYMITRVDACETDIEGSYLPRDKVADTTLLVPSCKKHSLLLCRAEYQSVVLFHTIQSLKFLLNHKAQSYSI